jgi:glutathione S-transferase
VPTLVYDGKAIIESALMCEYLDDTFPDSPLVPADPLLRSRMRIWSGRSRHLRVVGAWCCQGEM